MAQTEQIWPFKFLFGHQSGEDFIYQIFSHTAERARQRLEKEPKRPLRKLHLESDQDLNITYGHFNHHKYFPGNSSDTSIQRT